MYKKDKLHTNKSLEDKNMVQKNICTILNTLINKHTPIKSNSVTVHTTTPRFNDNLSLHKKEFRRKY